MVGTGSVVMEVKKSQDLSSASWRTRKASHTLQSNSAREWGAESVRPGLSLQAQEPGTPLAQVPGREACMCRLRHSARLPFLFLFAPFRPSASGRMAVSSVGVISTQSADPNANLFQKHLTKLPELMSYQLSGRPLDPSRCGLESATAISVCEDHINGITQCAFFCLLGPPFLPSLLPFLLSFLSMKCLRFSPVVRAPIVRSISFLSKECVAWMPCLCIFLLAGIWVVSNLHSYEYSCHEYFHTNFHRIFVFIDFGKLGIELLGQNIHFCLKEIAKHFPKYLYHFALQLAVYGGSGCFISWTVVQVRPC